MLSERAAGQTEEGPQWAAARQLERKQGRAEVGSRILPMFLTLKSQHAQAGTVERGIENVPAHVHRLLVYRASRTAHISSWE